MITNKNHIASILALVTLAQGLPCLAQIQTEIHPKSEKLSEFFINKSGQQVFEVGRENKLGQRSSENLIVINTSSTDGSTPMVPTQYWKTNGELGIEVSFEDGENFSEGLCAVRYGQGWGFADHSGKIVIKGPFHTASSFKNGIAKVRTASGWGYIKKDGTYLAQTHYKNCESFSEGLAAVISKDKVGFIDVTGAMKIEPQFAAARSFSDGLAAVSNNTNDAESTCYIDKQGKIKLNGKELSARLKCIPESISSNPFEQNGTLIGGKQLFVHLYFPVLDESNKDFHDGRLPANINGKYGYLNTDGKITIKPRYRSAQKFSEGIAAVKEDKLFSYIDTRGKTIVEPLFVAAKPFSEGMAAVSRDGKNYGYIDRTGKIVIPEKFQKALEFHDGVAKVAIQNSLADTISKAYKLTEEQTTNNVKIQFKISTDGYPYAIELRSGFSNPKDIEKTLKTILDASPFQLNSRSGEVQTRPNATANEPPKLTISSDLVANNTSVEEQATLDSNPYSQKQFQNDSVVRVWHLNQIIYLSQKFLEQPDSIRIRSTLSSCLKHIGLNSNNAHDWICLARGLETDLKVVRHPTTTQSDIQEAEVNAYLQAWKLQKSDVTYNLLLRAYKKYLASQCLTASEGDPSILASAAVLGGKLGDAVEILQLEKTKGNPKADQMLAFLDETPSVDVNIPTQSTIILNSNDTANNGMVTLHTLLGWLPPDTETVAYTRGPVNLERSSDPFLLPTSMALGEIDIEGTSLKKMLEEAKIIQSVSGSRDFKMPQSIGIGKYQGASIISLDSKTELQNIMAKLRPIRHSRRYISNVEVLQFNPKRHYAPDITFNVFSPLDGVLVIATDESYARELLGRIGQKENTSPLMTLEELKDLGAETTQWAIRHYDQSAMPFDTSAKTASPDSTNINSDEYGMTADHKALGLSLVSCSPGLTKLRYYSENPKILSEKVLQWQKLVAEANKQSSSPKTNQSNVDSASLPQAVTWQIKGNRVEIDIKETANPYSSALLIILYELGHIVAL